MIMHNHRVEGKVSVKLPSHVGLFATLWTGSTGSSVFGILQAAILEPVAISFSRRSSQPRDKPGSPALQADALPSEPPGKSRPCLK